MTVLRVDPWDPDYGASVETDEDPDRPPPPLDFEEPVIWAAITRPPPETTPCCAFIDGIRRVDLRLFAEDGDIIAPALAGSVAVGVAWSSRPPTIDDIRVVRVLLVGRGMQTPAVSAIIGSHAVQYPVESVAAASPRDALQQLQNRMRREEHSLATAVADRGTADLIVQDGPLTYTGRAPAVGMIKRQTQRYLDSLRQQLLPSLEINQRTPLFRFESNQLPRYSWYTRVAPRRRIDGSMAGLVRMEVHADVGLDRARELADLSAAVLPRFAAPLWRESRAPQNLYPVGQLETVLRNRLGHAEVIRRGLERSLWGASA
ncbi:MAG TPA: DNA double-strand break repair nuclease NurA [Chloroflexota bacterium]|nr:DNA double-strand break repair nuclease NurA [Chloroflexota bacterium]